MKSLMFILFSVLQCRIVLTACPSTCTCSSDSMIHIEGSVTNCSGIDVNHLSSVLANISSNVNTIYLDDIDIGNRRLVWPHFQQLNQLYIRRAGIENVSQILFGLQNVTSFHSLVLSENHISSLDSTSFQYISSIETLDLQYNKIRRLKAKTFNSLPNLSYLYLSFNQIEVIESNTFSALTNLVMLELDSNQLHWNKKTSPVLNGLKSLIEIKLQNNSITGVNDDFFLLTKKLKYVFLDNNALTSIPIRSCERLPHLTALYLTNNRISLVPEQLNKLQHLQYLYLTGNRITKVTSSLNSLESLKHVWLNKNNLREISQDLSTFFYRVKEINLLDNPWKCDCQLIWLIRWFNSLKNIHSPSCHENLVNVSWLDIPLDNVRCSVQKDCKSEERFCRKCPPFQYSIDGKICRCMEGYERLAGSSQCSVCPKGSYGNGISGCRQCSNNSISASEGSATCICRPGFYLIDNHCVECPVNTFKSKNGSYSCFPCPDYSTAPTGSVKSVSCICVNPDKLQSTYQTEYCLPPKTDSTALPISTFKETPLIKEDKHLDGLQVVIGAASFFCTMILIMVVAFYIRRYGYHRFSRRNVFKNIGTEKITLSSSDWLDGFAIGRDGNYSSRDIPIKKLKIGRALGKGAFGIVNEAYAYGGTSFDNKTFKVAVKRMKDTASGDEINTLKQELEQMILIGSHANIISLYGFCKCRGQSMIIMELAELGDLLTYLKEKCSNSHNYVSVSADGNISEEETKQITEEGELMSFAWQVAKGMSHMESLKCIHRDLAARNVLLTTGPVAKISDFGLSRDVYENGYYLKETKGRLPFKWLSPEALLWGQFSSKGDVWSYGMLLWEITTLGSSPYPGIPAENMANLHRSGYRMPRPPNCPKELYDIMRGCWDEDPRKRPTFLKLCELMENLLLGAVKLNYLEIRPNPIYNNEISDSYSDAVLTTLSKQESEPCLQKFYEHPCEHSSGYMSSGLYS